MVTYGEFNITTKDVVGVGSLTILLVFNNEKRFLKHNINSICSVGQSNKDNSKEGGYIGDKCIKYECFRFYILEIK